MEDLIQRIRDHYVEQFRGFVQAQCREFDTGVGEVKIRLNGEGLSNRLYCIDFLANIDGETVLRELQPDLILTFDPLTGSIGQADLEVLGLKWDDVILEHDLKADVEGLADWFDVWFDPEDKRHDPAAELSLCIHSLSVEPGRLCVDFGTAPPDAFWELMKVLLDAGVTQIRISYTQGSVQGEAAGD